MKYVKMLGLLGVVATAMMAFAGSAAATTLTSPEGTVYTSSIHATSEGAITFHDAFLWGLTPHCNQSTFQTDIEQHGSSATASGHITNLALTECTSPIYSIQVLNGGTLEIHTSSSEPNGSGIVTWSGAAITFTFTSPQYGNIDCIYKAENTKIGSIIGSKTTGGTATLNLEEAALPRSGGSLFFCGYYLEWTGSYAIDTPDYLDVD